MPWKVGKGGCHGQMTLCQRANGELCSSKTCSALRLKVQGIKGGTQAKKIFRHHWWVAPPCCVAMATSHVESTVWFVVHSKVSSDLGAFMLKHFQLFELFYSFSFCVEHLV